VAEGVLGDLLVVGTLAVAHGNPDPAPNRLDASVVEATDPGRPLRSGHRLAFPGHQAFIPSMGHRQDLSGCAGR